MLWRVFHPHTTVDNGTLIPSIGTITERQAMDYTIQPYLQNDLLLLRPLHGTDFDSLFAAASDPLIWEQHPQPNRYLKEVFKNFFEEALSSRGALLVLDRKNNSVIGTSRYYEVDLGLKQVAVGYTFLTREYWGGAYNKELKRSMLENAFNYFDSVIFHIGQFNLRSQKAMLKIGGVREGERMSDGHFIYRIYKDQM